VWSDSINRYIKQNSKSADIWQFLKFQGIWHKDQIYVYVLVMRSALCLFCFVTYLSSPGGPAGLFDLPHHRSYQQKGQKTAVGWRNEGMERLNVMQTFQRDIITSLGIGQYDDNWRIIWYSVYIGVDLQYLCKYQGFIQLELNSETTC